MNEQEYLAFLKEEEIRMKSILAIVGTDFEVEKEVKVIDSELEAMQ